MILNLETNGTVRMARARDAVRHLEQLSEHRLRDIGLTRDQIRDIV
jgi:uncharacterized protein YjiS (DUF1127 family)